jgi:thiosulfate/3-mercaptopyruvate sulfurtransferase
MGVNDDSHVVVYCDNAMLFSSRVWWAFKYHGLSKVSLLNGGWNNWVNSG